MERRTKIDRRGFESIVSVPTYVLTKEMTSFQDQGQRALSFLVPNNEDLTRFPLQPKRVSLTTPATPNRPSTDTATVIVVSRGPAGTSWTRSNFGHATSTNRLSTGSMDSLEQGRPPSLRQSPRGCSRTDSSVLPSSAPEISRTGATSISSSPP